jgi:hypothetical protein
LRHPTDGEEVAACDSQTVAGRGVPSFATGGRRAAKAGIAAAINISVMSSTTVTSIIKRLIKLRPLLTLPTGAAAPIVVKAARRALLPRRPLPGTSVYKGK